MDLARSVGTLSLVLRSQNDTAPVATQGARKRDVLLAEAPAPETPRVRHAPPPAAREERPEVLRGVKASTQCPAPPHKPASTIRPQVSASVGMCHDSQAQGPTIAEATQAETTCVSSGFSELARWRVMRLKLA